MTMVLLRIGVLLVGLGLLSASLMWYGLLAGRSSVRVVLLYRAIRGGPLLVIRVANNGERPVTLSSYALLVQNGRQVVLPTHRELVPSDESVLFASFADLDPSLPHRLDSGAVWRTGIPALSLARLLRSHGYPTAVGLVGVLRDDTGRTYESKSLHFDTRSWMV